MRSFVDAGDRRRLLGAAVASVAGLFAGGASALEFELDNGARVLWGTNVSVGAAWRAEGQAKNLVGGHNRTGGVGNELQDDGDLNYNKGDLVSAPVKVISDVEFRKNDTGILLRAKAWYDYAQSTRGVPHGSFANGYVPGARLDDSGYNNDAQFKGLRILDAYGYTRLNLGDMPMDLRIGKQVVNWGESLFILGLNQVNPIDLVSYHKPGMQLKEVLMPVEMAYANLGLAAGTSLEAFYQFKWRPYVLDGCGTYFSNLDIGLDPSCGAPLNGLLPRWANAGFDLTPIMNDRVFSRNGWNLERKADVKPGDGGQWGVAFRKSVEAIDSEVGVYHMNYHSRLPIVSAHSIKPFDTNTLSRITQTIGQCQSAGEAAYAAAGYSAAQALSMSAQVCGVNGSWGGVKDLGVGPIVGLLGTADYLIEYPKDIKLTAVSLATNLFGWSMGFELNQQRNFPVQLNVPDIVHAVALFDGPLAGRARSMANGFNPIFELAGFSLPNTQFLMNGYDRKTKTQLNVNAVKLLNNFGPASSGIVIAEVAVQHLNIPDPAGAGNPRYGRGFQWGFNFTGYQDSLNNIKTLGVAPTSCRAAQGWTEANAGEMCSNDGYFTRLSWGYRLMGQLTFNLSSGVTLKPTVYWAHDVKGSSADYQLVDKRKQLGLSLRAEYSARYYGEVAYSGWANGATYDQGRDRDFYSALVGMTF